MYFCSIRLDPGGPPVVTSPRSKSTAHSLCRFEHRKQGSVVQHKSRFSIMSLLMLLYVIASCSILPNRHRPIDLIYRLQERVTYRTHEKEGTQCPEAPIPVPRELSLLLPFFSLRNKRCCSYNWAACTGSATEKCFLTMSQESAQGLIALITHALHALNMRQHLDCS